MNLFLSRFGVAVYALLCGVVLAWWLPHFFAVNLTLKPMGDYRYMAATGVPFGIFLLTVLARQTLWPTLRLFLVFQVLVCSLTIYACKLSFYYLPQANFFCPVHCWFCFAFILINLYQYRRETKALEKQRLKTAAA